MSSTLQRTMVASALMALYAHAATSEAQTADKAPAVQVVRAVHPAAETLSRMLRPITTEFKETRLEEVMKFISATSGADLEFFWSDDTNASAGLNKDAAITATAKNISLLRLLEVVLEKADATDGGSSTSTWQMSEGGAMQVGPRARLNKFRRVEIYPVGDLLTEAPNYDGAPEFNLQQALQSGGRRGGGGGGQSPFQGNGGEDPVRRPLAERADELEGLLTDLVERDQWERNGGEGASIRFFQNTFIVNAPDYIHRQLNGYPWWPARQQRVASANGRRYVSFSVDTSASKISGIQTVPVGGAAGGTTGTGLPPGGG